MTGREKEIMGVVEGMAKAKATPRQIGAVLSITSGYAEQLCNIMVRKGYLAKTGYAFTAAKDFYEQFSHKTVE